MNRISISPAVLLLISTAFARTQEPREQPQPQQQEEARPNPNQNEEKPPKPQKREDANPSKDKTKPGHDQRSQQAQERHGHPAGKSAHIPDEKFRASFGHQHTFVINRPIIVEGQPRFQYAGYWFEIVDPWPVGWVYTDDCYIDYIDGEYFLFDVLHPGVRVVLFVSF